MVWGCKQNKKLYFCEYRACGKNKPIISVKFLFFYTLFITVSLSLFSQNTVEISGTVKDTANDPLEGVIINVVDNQKYNTVTQKNGDFRLALPGEAYYIIEFSLVGYTTTSISRTFKNGEKLSIPIILIPQTEELTTVNVDGRREQRREEELVKIEVQTTDLAPSISGMTGVLTSALGTSQKSELSSQYSVRGGNFDENLVVVNQTSIQRPFLVKSGQQEGLSFLNPDLVSSVEFSSGGFEARFEDKISSVLSINYKRPDQAEGSVKASFMGASAHYGNRSDNERFTYCTGMRYKNPSFVLGTLDGESIYKPSFLDFQTSLSYNVSQKIRLEGLLYAARNSYYFQPIQNEVTVGGFGETTKFMSYFEGSEQDNFNNYLGALNLHFKQSDNLHWVWTVDGFLSDESETYDIITNYTLSEALKDEVDGTQAWGRFQDHARNYFTSNVYSTSVYGKYVSFNEAHFVTLNKTEWGAKVKNERFDYNTEEWTLIDSADYVIPRNTELIEMSRYVKGDFEKHSTELNAFIQHSLKFTLSNGNKISLTGGVRGNYKNTNEELLISPRFRMAFIPDWDADIVFRFATGLYQQHPSMREFIAPDGEIVNDVKAQKTIHYVLGADYNLKIWNRPFKFVSEVYYKDLIHVIPYIVDNVKILYFPEQSATGFTTGIDMKLNGEFIEGAESWMSLSIMNSKEKIVGDSTGYHRRPSDQRVNFGLFFQDYLPRMKTLKMNMSLFFGTNLPVWYPSDKKEGDYVARIPMYQRADIGLLKEFKIFKNKKPGPEKRFWVGVEIFNALDASNVASYYWINDVKGSTYGVPNRLTKQALNVKTELRF